MKTLIFTTLILFGVLAPAQAAPLRTPAIPEAEAHPLAQSVRALNCVQVVNIQGRPSLINRCGECRIVTLERKRPSDTVPITRTYTLPAKAKIEHAFRGPGRTRVTSDQSCSAPTGGAQSAATADGQRCIGFQRVGGQVVVVNTCQVCRMAQIERFGGTGGSSEATIMVAPRSYSAMSSNGASQARVLAEANCS